MAATSTRYTQIVFSGDVNATNRSTAASNSASPAAITYVNFISGDNTIVQPAGTITAVTIEPPSTNIDTDDTDPVTLILKGDADDVGIPLHNTDPSTIALGSSPIIIINASDALNGVRFIWS